MKQIPIFCLALATFFLVACGPKDSRQSFDDPTVYNDFVVDALTELDLTYANALNMNQGQEKCLLMCDSLVFKSEATLKKLEGIQPYEGDSSFTMAARDFAQYMKRIGKNDLPTFIHKVFDPELIETDRAEIDRLAADLDKTYNAKLNEINTVQKALAKKFDYTIVK